MCFVAPLACLLGWFAATPVFAAEPAGPPHGRGGPCGRTPPPEALAACTQLSAGASCTVTWHGTPQTGLCKALPKGTGLACMPQPPLHHEPPVQAVAACDGLAAQDRCAVALGEQNLVGTCELPPDGNGVLACHPAHPPHGDRPLGPPPEAVAACANLLVDASCSVNLHDQTVNGTCKIGPDGNGELACLPYDLPLCFLPPPEFEQ